MGKTRLAFEVAAAALNDGKDGTWFVDLASISDGALVISVLALGLGVDQAKGVAPLEVLLKFLEERELLLVLDNCEHLIDEVARVVAAMLGRCRYVTVLATSREPLNIGGENVYHISGLDLDLAVRLFDERAGAASRNFAAQTKRPFVEDICREARRNCTGDRARRRARSNDSDRKTLRAPGTASALRRPRPPTAPANHARADRLELQSP